MLFDLALLMCLCYALTPPSVWNLWKNYSWLSILDIVMTYAKQSYPACHGHMYTCGWLRVSEWKFATYTTYAVRPSMCVCSYVPCTCLCAEAVTLCTDAQIPNMSMNFSDCPFGERNWYKYAIQQLESQKIIEKIFSFLLVSFFFSGHAWAVN